MSSITDLFSALQNGVKAINSIGVTATSVNSNLSAINTTLTGIATLGVCGVQLLTSAGTTYTPTAGTKAALIFGQAAGGGGGLSSAIAGQAGGGHGGAGETRLLALTPVSGTYTYSVGTAGTAGTASSASTPNGGTASDTTFGSVLTCKGGTGGTGSSGSGAGAMGTTPTGSGGTAFPPTSTPQYTFSAGGPRGASTLFGTYNISLGNVINAISSGIGAANGVAGDGFGSGGTGAFRNSSTASSSGGPGANGMLLVIEFN